MRRFRIRMKMAAALAAPLLGLVLFTALEVRAADNAVGDVRDHAALAQIELGPSSVLSAIEDERNTAGVYLQGQEDASLWRRTTTSSGA